jgi:hypothetical protein
VVVRIVGRVPLTLDGLRGTPKAGRGDVVGKTLARRAAFYHAAPSVCTTLDFLATQTVSKELCRCVETAPFAVVLLLLLLLASQLCLALLCLESLANRSQKGLEM